MTVFLITQTDHLALILYTVFIRLYVAGIQLASLWSHKARQWKRGRKTFPTLSFNSPTIWMHCASLGEFEQGRPVLEACKQAYPTYPIVVSFFSPSGYEVRKNDPLADAVFYLPIDTPQHAKRLIKAINPAVVFWVKYDYWFHYLNTLQQQHIPVFLVSGIFRPSQPFLHGMVLFGKKCFILLKPCLYKTKRPKHCWKDIFNNRILLSVGILDSIGCWPSTIKKK